MAAYKQKTSSRKTLIEQQNARGKNYSGISGHSHPFPSIRMAPNEFSPL